MNEAARQYHYSVRHWNKQFRDTDLYIDRINAETNKLEGRMPWSWWPDKDTGLTPGITPSTAETITRLDRLKHLRASASDRLRYAHVMRFKMCNDKLLINGIAFDTMLEDERKALHARIDKSRKHIEAHIEARKFKERLQGMGLAQRCMAILDHIHKQTAPPYQLGGLDNTRKEELVYVDVHGKAHPLGIVRDQVGFLPAGVRIGPGYRLNSPLIYGPGGKQLQEIPDSAEIVLRHMEHRRPKVYFVSTLAEWHKNLPGVAVPERHDLVKIKKQIWKRVL